MAGRTLRESLEGVAGLLGRVPVVGGVASTAVGAATQAFDAIPGSGAARAAAGAVAGRLPDQLTGAARDAARATHAADVLVEAGVVAPLRPDKAAEALSALRALNMSPAAGFVVSAIRYPHEAALVDERGALTFDELDRRTNALANSFADAGVNQGDAVAIMCRDHRGFVETTVALSKIGATALYFNTQFAGPQLADVVKREDPAGIVYDQEFTEVLQHAVRERHRWIAWTDDPDEARHPTLEQLIEEGDTSSPPEPEEPGNIVLLTSGSTGTPKGASRGDPDALEAIVALLSTIPYRSREPTVMAAPLFHAWGFLNFNLGMLLSTTYVLRRKFDPEATLANIARHRATALVAVPVMLQRILDLPKETREQYDTSSLRVVAASGGALTSELANAWMDQFGDNLYNLYGSTEVAWAAIATPEDLRAAPGTAGKPPPGTSIRILDEESHDRLPANNEGLIYVGNEMLFEGYTGGGSEEIVDGHMETGDRGYLDEDGRLFVVGRADEMIVSGGENVYPQEVEEVIKQHAKVGEAVVLGVEDEKFGERLKAFVVKKGQLSEKQLQDHVKSNLANFKVPREVEFIDELPRNPQGKVDKQKLKGEKD